jgi:4-alpha-glucanotransferase
MINTRAAGVLLHPTSLPGPYGVGELGSEALQFLDWAVEAGLRVWQVLPLGPTCPDGSPYSSPSAFAGNPLLISPEGLSHAGWLHEDDFETRPVFRPEQIDFQQVAQWKARLLRRSWKRFLREASSREREELDAFAQHTDQAYWLEDWVLYAAIKEHSGGRPWTRWGRGLRDRDEETLRAASRELAEEIDYQRYLQFVFFRQWERVRQEAHARGLTLFGDVPFYVAPDSADVWAHRDIFKLDSTGRPTRVAGVPPDYFSETGQLWGNPVYRWNRLAQQGYHWWIERIRANLRLVGSLRLDHFRGFAGYWEIELPAETAAEGHWVAGPGRALFDALQAELGGLPLVAEDLGVITEDVEALRDGLELPGMHVLQFAFDDPQSKHLPQNHPMRSVAYTGTHDNDTLRGWFEGLDEDQRRRVVDQVGDGPNGVVWSLIGATYGSPAVLALVPLQDMLSLGSEARMNRPGTTRGNWRWRVQGAALTLELAAQLRELARSTDR